MYSFKCNLKTQTSVLWDWELMYFQAYVYIVFVYRVVCVDMSTRSSQLNHLNLESLNLLCLLYYVILC